MAYCPECDKDMGNANTCTFPYLQFDDGKILKRNTTYFDNNDFCHDCGIENKKGNLHHYGCDMERCPRCKGQLIGCDCNNDQDKIPLISKSKKKNQEKEHEFDYFKTTIPDTFGGIQL